MRKAVKKSFTRIGKALVLLLMVVYVLFSVGIIKSTHFCMGREASVQFFTSEAKNRPFGPVTICVLTNAKSAGYRVTP